MIYETENYLKSKTSMFILINNKNLQIHRKENEEALARCGKVELFARMAKPFRINLGQATPL